MAFLKSTMGVQVTVAALSLLFGAVIAKSSMLELTREWKPNFGWEVVCSWKLFSNDSLQSIRLYKTDQQFLIYRPQTDGRQRSALIRLPTMEFQAHCYEIDENGVTGKCVMTLEVLLPVKQDLSYTCEVSGERPLFRSEAKTIHIEALVRPTDAVVETIAQNDPSSGRVSVNCTSAGLPAPTLVWTIGDQKIPADFAGASWNFTSKLYHVWSSLSYTPDGLSHAVCSPEIVKEGQLLRGKPAQYNGARILGGVTSTVCLFLILVLTS